MLTAVPFEETSAPMAAVIAPVVEEMAMPPAVSFVMVPLSPDDVGVVVEMLPVVLSRMTVANGSPTRVSVVAASSETL